MSDKQIIDAEFEVAERRLPIHWGSVLRHTFLTALFALSAYAMGREGFDWAGPYFVIVAALQFPVARLLKGLTGPRLSPEEVEPLAQRLMRGVPFGRGRPGGY